MVVHGALDLFWEGWAQHVQNALVELHRESVRISGFGKRVDFGSYVVAVMFDGGCV